MPDVFSKSKRSEVMSRVRSRGNRDTELALARLFRSNGIRGWRRHLQLKFQVPSSKFRLPSSRPHGAVKVRPDFVFPGIKLAVFVDGCFWHGCPRHVRWPGTRAAWWRRKIEGNRARDRRVNRALRRAGWRVLHIWEHELARKNEARLVRRLAKVFHGPGADHEFNRRERKELRRGRSGFAISAFSAVE